MTEWCSCNRLIEAEEKAAKWDAIVRCGECEFFLKCCWICAYRSEDLKEVTPDHFCAYGLRREDA